MRTTSENPPQTPAQWAVRWFCIAAGLLFLCSVPVVHLVWHVALGHGEPAIRTRSQVPAPAWSWEEVRDGSWMIREELHLREASPIVWWLRGTWNELRYRAGVPQSDQVHVGANEWFFITPEVFPDRAAFERARPLRRRFLREVRDLVKAAGAELFVMVVPDKARVYPELAYPGGVMPPEKAGNYAAILADLEAEGIATTDVAAAMAAVRAADPKTELYYRRDTHWRPEGALVGGQAAAAAIEQRFGSLLSPPRNVELGAKESHRLIGDLPANLGIGTIEVFDEERGRMRTVAMSLLAERLAERRDYYGIAIRDGDRTLPMRDDDPGAEILLLGTSFSEENGAHALSFALRRPVRLVMKHGPEGILPLRDAEPELRAGTRAKLVVWELVERGFFAEKWHAPTLAEPRR